MVWSWFPAVASTVMQVFEIGATIGVGIACPPLAPVVGGALAIGGSLINNAIEKEFAQDNGQGGEAGNQGLSDEQFNELTWRIEDISKSIEDNKEFILDNKEEILRNRDEIFNNRDLILNNRDLLLANQDIVIRNQELILQNQEMLFGIQEMINETAAENRELVKGLGTTLSKFEFNMNQNFEYVKTFMVEKDFIRDVTMPLDALWNKMEDACNSRTNRSINDFKRFTEQGHALDFLDKALGYLGDIHTNPVESAMLSNPLKSRAILKHYMGLFSQLVVKVIAIEGFHYGLTDRTKRATNENMKALNQKIDKAINKMRDFFIKVTIPKEKYWPDLIEQTAISLNDETNESLVADKIRAELDGIHTKDVFNIFAFRCEATKPCEPTTLLREAPPAGSKQKTMVGGLNKETRVRAIVMRSERHHNASSDDTLALRSGYRSYMTLMWKWQKDPCDKAPFEEVVDGMIVNATTSINAFLICDVERAGVARITNNETGIIEDGDMEGGEKFYYGLSWI